MNETQVFGLAVSDQLRVLFYFLLYNVMKCQTSFSIHSPPYAFVYTVSIITSPILHSVQMVQPVYKQFRRWKIRVWAIVLSVVQS